MVQIIKNGVYFLNNKYIIEDRGQTPDDINNQLSSLSGEKINEDNLNPETAKKNTMAYNIISEHNTSGNSDIKIKFDAMASHDITYVGIVQTARASGLKEFPLPYVLTNCHNSLCAVGGTINEDDHLFGLSAAQKYGGIYVPAHQAVIHQYMREAFAGCGKMILGSDSHTRYGAFGTLAIGEGGPELVKQLLGKTYDIKYPDIIAIYLEGTPKPGVGPQDIALAIIGATFKEGTVKNKILEFVGPGIEQLSMEYRSGIDVMTTETTCLSSIWCTDEKVRKCLEMYGRGNDFKELCPGDVAYYDGFIKIDLSTVEPMIALPFHPSNVYTISELKANAEDMLRKVELDAKEQLDSPNIDFRLTDKVKNGAIQVEQGVIAGCSGGTFENIYLAANILDNKSIGNGEFALSIYPASQPVNAELIKCGAINKLINAGATIRTAFCGPCFGAGDVPANNTISIRHTTRNFPNREGSKPANGQIASVALMDARSIAATAMNGGILTSAAEIDIPDTIELDNFDAGAYKSRVYSGFGKAKPELELKFGPNIADWPKMGAMTDNLLLKVAALINDPVTTTDELIPSGETSSFRSNPLKLAEFTLSRKAPEYVEKAKEIQKIESKRPDLSAQDLLSTESGNAIYNVIKSLGYGEDSLSDFFAKTSIGSLVFANKPGDGSAREQAASCQRVLDGRANIALEYATKRYRSNLINWGIVPFIIDESQKSKLHLESYIFIPEIKSALENGDHKVNAIVFNSQERTELELKFDNLTKDERMIILSGCLINYYQDNI